MPWQKILAVLFVLALVGGLVHLGSRIPPNDSGPEG
jgi:hypothetical protein